MTKRAILTYWNFQSDSKITLSQNMVIFAFSDISTDYKTLNYNAPDGVVFPDQVIDFGLNCLFDQENYDTVLILDVDCVPLSSNALKYTFEQAESGKLVGDIQRSNHLQNNEHVFIGSSCFCLTRQVYNDFGKLSFACTDRGDIGEEYTYRAEQSGYPLEMYMPKSFQAAPHGCQSWPLKTGMPHYGIGTTFVNKDGDEMFYHLFESRTNLNVELFLEKCNSIMESIKVKI